MRVFIRRYRFTGMAMERMLSQFRRDAPGRGVAAERVVAVGFLARCLEAAGPGMQNPAYLQRDAVEAEGVKLIRSKTRAKRVRKQDTKCGSGWINFKRKRDEKWRGQQDRVPYHEWLKVLSAEWKELPKHEKLREFNESRLTILARKDEAHEGASEPTGGQGRVLRTFIDDLKDQWQPVAETKFLSMVQEITGCGESHPGFTRYEQQLRARLLEQAYVSDQGAIPGAKKFKRRLTCPEVHPGFCVQTDSDILGPAGAATSDLFEMMSQCKAGTAWLLSTTTAGRVRETWFFLEHNRYNNPKFNLVCEAEPVGRKVRLTEEEHEHDTSSVGLSFMAGAFRACGGAVERMHVSPAPQDVSVCAGGGAILLLEDWQERVRAERVQMFPPVAQLARARLPQLRWSQAFLKALDLLEPGSANRSKKKKPKGVHEVGPAGDSDGGEADGDGGVEGASDAGAPASSDSDEEEHFDPDHFAALAGGGAAGGGAAGGGAAGGGGYAD